MTEAGVLTVLVADDEAGIRTGVRRSLAGLRVPAADFDRELTFEVVEAADGAEARRLLAAGPVDLLLLDHSMPQVTGMELLAELGELAEPPLTVMITAYATLDMAVRATKQGVFDFLAKPFTPEELRRVMEKAARNLLAERTARRLAAEKRRVRFEFLSVLAHELKAPLGAVEGYLRLLGEGVGADDPAKVEHMIGRSLERLGGMRKLIYDLLDLTRIESGQKQRELTDLDTAAIVRRVLETFQPAAAARGIQVAFAATGDAAFHGDAGEIEIILNNLISNAIKYNRDGGRVEVRLGGGPDGLELAVRDTGLGMSAEDCGRLFGEFVRIRNDATRRIEGSGLGLSIVRRLAHLNGGEATVSSTPGAGSVFTVTLSRKGGPA